MTLNLPTIIVIGYNRPKSLNRLLGSLRKAHYPPGNVRLVISLDNSGNPEPRDVATDFDWPFGEKRIIAHETRLGLRNHVLSCGDLTEEYGDVVVLEDDLFVSPYFYEYTSRALNFYSDDPEIAGISLYSQQFSQTANLPFTPVDNGNSDVYFMQLAASWGQAWSRSHWVGFRHWIEQHGADISGVDDIPADIRNWPESSWLKLHNAYIISLNKYFVYPYRSLSTNFGDPGQHFNIASSRFQVAIQQQSIDYQFAALQNGLAIYDAFCELLPSSLKKQNEKLNGYDFIVNLYGCKDCRSGLQLTRTTQKGLLNFSLSMKPMELSVMHDLEGEGIALIDTADVNSASLRASRTEYDMYRFFYKFPSPKVILFGLKERIQIMFRGSHSR
ncbi:MAG TPA: glycosyl transferase family 2 [Pseudomonas xinjiangensis]|uniref:Glycosyl transferase family 2 n=2 Tax=root TaxID=1 RepID=A0A7V1BR62_9GAMM|nr:glycosyl transferase family 2 [Halopseudomonas xinjiangensis]HEC47894.1 glycosyl transferase family 2 [Halopseudomonas xinjiangensis]